MTLAPEFFGIRPTRSFPALFGPAGSRRVKVIVWIGHGARHDAAAVPRDGLGPVPEMEKPAVHSAGVR